MIDKYIENNLLERYLIQAANSLGNATIRDKKINIKCNVCGDSKTNKNIKRGHLMLTRNPYRMGDGEFWCYKCFNEGDCAAAGEGNAWSAQVWLQRYFPSLYSSFTRDLMKNYQPNEIVSRNEIIKDEDEVIQSITKEKVERETALKLSEEEQEVKHFKLITKGKSQLFEKARKYCEERKIPKNIWRKFFVSEDGKTYKNRLIIPFYDNNNKIYYFQARSLTNMNPKYINRKDNKDNAIYNIYNIDTKKPVIILEGPIDSMFCENSIATLGLGISKEMQDKIDQFDSYYIFDNDKPGNNSAKKFLKKHKSVFIWSKFLNDYKLEGVKDINDVFLKLEREKIFTFTELEKYFTKSKFDLIYF